MKCKQGYYLEWNGEQWQSVFPSNEAHKSKLHDTMLDAFEYMYGECSIREDITLTGMD